MDYYDLDQFPQTKPPIPEEQEISTPSRLLYQVSTFALTFLISMFTWVLLSGKFDSFHLGLGVLSSAMVAHFSRDLLFSSGTLVGLPRLTIKFIAYLPWLMWQIVLANLHVLRIALSPKMAEHLDPHIIRLNTKLKTDLSLVTYANSVTLTPGTITVYAHGDGLVTIHALDRGSGDENALRAMEDKVAAVFGES